jgi:hypothetical protein
MQYQSTFKSRGYKNLQNCNTANTAKPSEKSLRNHWLWLYGSVVDFYTHDDLKTAVYIY